MAMFRSTKGASKQRRDLINSEISNLRDLLPLPESARQRLSQLQIMSLGCCYIRKCNYFARLFGTPNFVSDTPFEFAQSMTGFLLITTREGKLLYISDNVTEFLGHSMVDMLTQGDSLYDIIDKKDHAAVQAQLLTANPPQQTGTSADERIFFCRMNVSRSFRRQAGFGDHKVMHVKGHFIQPLIRDHYGNQPVFMALCSPLITPDVKETMIQNNTMVYQSVHGLDMKYIEISQTGEFHLGYSDVEIYGKSWYDLLHPEDLAEAKEKHMQLIKSSHEMGCMLTIRLQSKFGDWVWVNMVMHVRQPFICDNSDPAIVCINHIIAETEAPHFKMQSQLYSSHIARSPEFLSSPQGASPPHTITQVAMDRDQLPGSFTGMVAEEGPLHYHAQFGVTVTSAINPDPNGSQMEGGSVSTHKTQDSDSNGQHVVLGDQEQKPVITRADIINRLKRKMTEMSREQCKPAKMPRFGQSNENDQNNGQGTISISGSALIAEAMFIEDSAMASLTHSGGNYGPVEVLGAIPDHIMPHFSLKKEVEVPESIDIRAKSPIKADTMIASMPPTPESVTSEVAENINTITGGLTIEVPEVAVVPPSILTPDSSPSTSPLYTTSNSVMSFPKSQEQCVPSLLADLEETSLFQDLENDSMSIMPDVKPQIKKAKGETNLPLLPILDVLSLEKYLQAVEGDQNMKNAMKQARKEHDALHQTPQNVGSPASVCSSEMPGSPESMDTTDGTAELNIMPQDQLNTLMASVTDALLDMVQLQSARQSTNVSGVTGGFMLVPNQENCNDTLLSTVQLDDLHPLSPSAGDFLDELHQLELSNTTPSYGEETLSSALFDQTL